MEAKRKKTGKKPETKPGKPGRPRKYADTKRLQVLLPADLLGKITDRAREKKQSRNAVVVELLEAVG